MKKNVGFISLDSSLVKWLRDTLRTSAPQTASARELMEGFQDLMDGNAGSLMLFSPQPWGGVHERTDLSGGVGA